MNTQPTKAHEKDMNYSALCPAVYQDGICSQCGGMTVELAIQYLLTPGTKFSGADWKYGFCHKLYVTPLRPVGKGHLKFMTAHLADADDETLARFSELSKAVFGITWARGEKGIHFSCPRSTGFHGFQRFGEIDENGKPNHLDGFDTPHILKILDAKPEPEKAETFEPAVLQALPAGA